MTIDVLSICVGVLLVTAFAYLGIPWLYGGWLRFSLANDVRRRRCIALTFDDGPGKRMTASVLEILNRYNVKATFFLLGRNIAGREEVVRQIAQSGHEICSHGYEHINYRWANPFRAVADIKRGWSVLDSALGKTGARYPFRPPYGRLNLICMLYLLFCKVPVVYWTLDCGDTGRAEGHKEGKQAFLSQACSGAVILMHDFDRKNPQTESLVLDYLASLLEKARSEGTRVATIARLYEDDSRRQ